MPAVRANRRRLRRPATIVLALVLAVVAVGAWIGSAATLADTHTGLSPLTQGLLAAAWTAYVLAVFFRRPESEDNTAC